MAASPLITADLPDGLPAGLVDLCRQVRGLSVLPLDEVPGRIRCGGIRKRLRDKPVRSTSDGRTDDARWARW